MQHLSVYLLAGGVLGLVGLAAWPYSVARRNVNLVDTLWPLFFLAAMLIFVWRFPEPRAILLGVLVAIWSLRLALHLAVRNFGQPEDHRYQSIRRNHEPGFAWKSLYLVFGLQAALAWLIALPLFAATALAQPPLGVWDYAGVALWVVGMGFESVGDRQLRAFRRDPANRNRVLDGGLWRYTRHPNYFGEFCVWWGFACFAIAVGAWWAIVSPLLMTGLLLRVSGVALMERDISSRRPEYRDYVARTNAFFPGPPRATRCERKEAS